MSPLSDTLEWVLYGIDVAVWLCVLSLLLGAAATAVCGAATAVRRPLRPRAEWATKPERSGLMTLAIVGGTAAALAVVLIGASLVADMYLRVRGGGA